MHAIIRGVEVEDQLAGRHAERSDELVGQNLMQPPGGGAIRAVFQSAERGTRSQWFDLLDGRLPDRVQPQGVVIVEVFVAVAQAVDALAQQRMLGMFNQRRVARIGQHLRHRPGQTQAAIQLAQQRQPAVTGHVTTGKTGGYQSLFYGWKFEKLWVTNCPRRSGGLRVHFTPIDIGAQPSLRLFNVKFSSYKSSSTGRGRRRAGDSLAQAVRRLGFSFQFNLRQGAASLADVRSLVQTVSERGFLCWHEVERGAALSVPALAAAWAARSSAKLKLQRGKLPGRE